ncbi:P-loop containing nucleoside triphosphate hydrolase protein [Flagelloscypha sp. PMI_526]|nr:P-loop containing nucleoside triphosphate hydrolase protein [Flagelloscypha sp. PMI_526]
MSSQDVANSPSMQVVNFGLGRTGSLSFSEAMEILGFGPCYHMKTIMQTGGKDFDTWMRIQRGENPVENLKTILTSYKSAADYPIALYPEACFAAYPNAKYVISVRPAAEWKLSVQNTIHRATSFMYWMSWVWPLGSRAYAWVQEAIWNGQFEGKFEENAEQKFEEHTERVKRVVPEGQLLVFQVGEGWERLCKFLEVPVPEVPYPHSNASTSFGQMIWAHLPKHLWPVWAAIISVDKYLGSGPSKVKMS